MSYAIVKFDRYSLQADCLYTFSCSAPYRYVTDSFPHAVDVANSAAAHHYDTAAYAIFNVYGISFSEASSRVPVELDPNSPFCRLSPVFIPSRCNDDLRAAFGSVWQYRPTGVLMPVPVPEAPSAPVAEALVSPRFEVRAGLVGTDRDNWSPVMDFATGKEAADWVSANRSGFAEAGKALVIVKVEASAVVSSVDWRGRERLRLSDGTYTPLPGDWFTRVSHYYPDHFVHVAQSDKCKVAFTESESAGERDKQKVLTASAYVERFFGEGARFYWPSSRRVRFVADMLGDSVKPLFAPLGDTEALEAVYRDTEGGACHGCMSYSAGTYSSPFHPVHVYALGGDITVALLRAYPEGGDESGYDPGASWDSDGAIIARCLVWPESKQYGRVYGLTDNDRLLRTALEAQGYRSGDLCGAKIAKVEYGSTYVMPYLDIGNGSVEDMGSYFVAGGDISATRTDGLLETGVSCERCGDMVEPEDMGIVFVDRGETERWCEYCRDHSATWCDYDESYIADSHVVSYIPSGSGRCDTESISEWGLEAVGAAYVESRGEYCEDFFVCDECGETFHTDDLEEHGDKSVCMSCLTYLEESEAEAAEAEAASDAAAPIAA